MSTYYPDFWNTDPKALDRWEYAIRKAMQRHSLTIIAKTDRLPVLLVPVYSIRGDFLPGRFKHVYFQAHEQAEDNIQSVLRGLRLFEDHDQQRAQGWYQGYGVEKQ